MFKRNLTQSLNFLSDLDHICHFVFPFSLPTLFFDGSVQHINLVCQRIVDQEHWKFCSWGAGNLWLGMLYVLWLLKVLGLGALENLLYWLLCALQLSAWDVLLGALSILLVLTLQITIPVLFLFILEMGAIWSPYTYLFYLLQCHSGTGDHCFMGLCLNFYCGGRCRCGRNWPVLSGLKQVFSC